MAQATGYRYERIASWARGEWADDVLERINGRLVLRANVRVSGTWCAAWHVPARAQARVEELLRDGVRAEAIAARLGLRAAPKYAGECR